jgi:hypothetical protein
MMQYGRFALAIGVAMQLCAYVMLGALDMERGGRAETLTGARSAISTAAP